MAKYLLIIALSAYSLNLFLTNRLNYYIHPRYIVFSGIMSGIALLIGFIGFAVTLWKITQSMQREETVPLRLSWRSIPILTLVILIVALALPPQTLSPHIASQRTPTFNTLTIDTAQTSSSILFNTDSTSLTINEWVIALGSAPDLTTFAGKQVSVIGFIYTGDTASQTNQFYVARFVITCCAVDARPVGIAVLLSDWQAKFKLGAWVQVSGVWVVNDGHLAVQPTHIIPTAQPEDPYEQ